MPRTLIRPRLQRPPAGQHDADHRRRQHLPGRHRAGQGEQRDHVNADAAMPDAVDRGPHRIADPASRRGQPRRVSDRTGPGQTRHPARGQARRGHYQQHQRRTATKLRPRPPPCPPDNTPHHDPSLQRRRQDSPCPKAPLSRPFAPRLRGSEGLACTSRGCAGDDERAKQNTESVHRQVENVEEQRGAATQIVHTAPGQWAAAHAGLDFLLDSGFRRRRLSAEVGKARRRADSITAPDSPAPVIRMSSIQKNSSLAFAAMDAPSMVAAHTNDIWIINRPKIARSSCGSSADIMPPLGRQASGPE